MIVKIQRPIQTNGSYDVWLFYNETQSYIEERIPTDAEQEAMGNNYKIYAQFINKKFHELASGQHPDW